ncbi:MAG TPA: HAMP domain-containing sensor histidine kinase [Longimicrobium sp.]|jgi:signal transduction histidine kinase|nr:HAMP domain-containing sensor histidine kinase [Longimicrobium sp.]
MIHVAAQPDSAAETRRLRACVRDLVALSTVGVWWIGRPAGAIAESLRDLMLRVLRCEAAYVRVADPGTGEAAVAVAGATAGEVEAALEAIAGRGAAGPAPPAEAALRVVWAPIGLEGRGGCLAAGSRRPDFPAELDRVLVQVAANQAAVALQHAALLQRHARAERMMAAQAARQAAVARLGLRALDGVAPERLLDELVEAVRETLGGDVCEVMELAEDGASLLLKAGAGWGPDAVGRARVSAGPASQWGYTLLAGEPVVVADLAAETRFAAHPLLRARGVRSGVTVIVRGHAGPFGVLGAHARAARAFTPDEADFLQSVANLLAAALQRHRAEAEREELLARTLAAQEQAERAAQSKSDFLAVMSHELRTPLGTISGYVDLLELGVHGTLNEMQHEDLARIRRCQKFLLGLINNVLAYMKLGSGRVRYDLTSVSVAGLAASVEELIRPQLDARHLRFEKRLPDGGVRVRADREKLEQIVLNLLSNATKFTEPGGSVELEGAVDGGTVGIHVRDTGCGIPPDHLESVFDPYVQVAGAAPRHAAQGTGLGLAISRDLARGMGGDIRLESRLGEGSTFTVVLPLDREPASASPASTGAVPDPAPM